MGTVSTDLLPVGCDLPVPSQSVGSKSLALSPQETLGGSRSSTSEISTMNPPLSLHVPETSLMEVPSRYLSYPRSREDRSSPEACLSSTIKGLLNYRERNLLLVPFL